MSGFLDRMAGLGRLRVTEAQAREPLPALRARSLATPPPPPLQLQDRFNLIAEVKHRSPALGSLGDDDLAGRVSAYARAGAAAVSVLTEPAEFHGSLVDLAMAAAALAPVGVPVLRKDFLVDPYQLYETRAASAGGALLIVRMLSGNVLAEMMDCARELQLFVLLEAFDVEDVERATTGIRRGCPLATRNPDAPLGDTHRHLGRGAVGGSDLEEGVWTGTAADTTRAGEVAGSPRASESRSPERASGEPGRIPPDRVVPSDVLLGVNCRDLQSLAVLPQRFSELAPLLPRDIACVAESGITTPDDCAEVARNGYRAALVGSALMTSPDPEGVIRTMLAAGRAAS